MCEDKESFDGWFENIDAFEKQKEIGLLTCPYCGSNEVSKNLMSPSIKSSKIDEKKRSNQQNDAIAKNVINKNNFDSRTFNEAVTMLRSLKKEIESKAEFVGNKFVKEARAIKSGKAKERPIYGHAKPEKVEELKDEGIDVASIPWIQDDH